MSFVVVFWWQYEHIFLTYERDFRRSKFTPGCTREQKYTRVQIVHMNTA